MKVIYILATMLLLIISTTNLNAQDWDSFNERERRVYLLGWHGVIEASVLVIIKYMLSDNRPDGYCSSSFTQAFSNTYDSLDTYHFGTADIDSLIHLTDEFLLFNENRKEILQEAINYFKRGKSKYGHIIEFRPIFDGINISEGLVKSDILANELSLDDAVEVVIGKWANRYEHEEGVGTIILWSELEITEKIIYVDGWFDGIMFTYSKSINIARHFALEDTKFQRAMKELSISGYEEDCILHILNGILELSGILESLRPNMSKFFKEKYTLIPYLDQSIKNSQEGGHPISNRTTILSVADGIKNWNSESEE